MLLESPSRIERGYAPEDAEARRDLVKRILASSSFAKSNRLSEFLKYVYTLAEKGRFEDIHEQNIGSAVFGRTRDYDPGDDSIVRSHASRLRHRLKEYFEQDGQEEEILLSIPRGSYIPAFEPRVMKELGTDTVQASMPDSPTEGGVIASEASPSIAEAPPGPAGSDHAMRTVARLRGLLIAASLVICLLAVLLVRSRLVASPSHVWTDVHRNALWNAFLDGNAGTVVVSADSGLVMYQHLTGNQVSLASYISGEYLKHTTSAAVPEDVVRKFGTRRYTPALDLTFLDRFTRIFGEKRDRLTFHYARDLRMEDLKQGNAILLGSAESNPWVQLFEPSMNFVFQDDLLHDKARMVNRHPKPGEEPYYDSTPQDPAPTVYGVVAYRPNLQTAGHVLILEGQTMAGTQTAADFVFDDSYLLPFLEKIRRADGSLPYFELLLRSSSFSGQSSHIAIVAYRIENS